MVGKKKEEDMKAILMDLLAEEKQNHTLWSARTPPRLDDAPEMKDSEVVPERYEGLEALWTLVASASSMYNERYEGSFSLSGASKGRHQAEIRTNEGLKEAGKKLKQVMRKRFKFVDGQVYFEIHRGEWVKTSEDPLGPCKTCRSLGEVACHWVWRCPSLK